MSGPRECPFVPEGATDLEDALITSAWRDAVDTYAQIARDADYVHAHLTAGQEVTIQDRGAISAAGARASTAEAQMRTTIEATRRRLGHKKHPYTGEWTIPETTDGGDQ